MGACQNFILLIVNILIVLFILIPVGWFIETVIRSLAVIWVILKQTKCSSFRQLLTLILSILAYEILLFIFGIWGIVQIILNILKYFEGRKKYQVTSQNMIRFLWAEPHIVFDGVLDIFASIRGAPLSHKL